MTIRFLINDDGTPFESSEIKALRGALDSLGNDEREEHRNRNASAIAQHNADKFLIVSGPGTGKSHLFMAKINHWYQNDQEASVFITSFVRKLVLDLQNDIKRNERLTDNQKSKITVFTLHKFARRIVEKNHGTNKWRFGSHFQIIAPSWMDMVWNDVLAFYPDIKHKFYELKRFKEQLHDNNFDKSGEWKAVKETYFKLCQFYNAAGFADLILRATKALTENPDLNKDNYFIIDEYQDFNHSEEALISQLVNSLKGLLVVGDDEQILYENLKSAKPTLIRNLYKNTDYVKGMLPFCGRSSFHITKTADHFIRQHSETESIIKIYLPLKTHSSDSRVQIVACAAPSTAIDYIETFVANHKTEIDERKRQLEDGKEKDAFLLILTPAKEVKFYCNKKFDGKKKLDKLVAEYQTEMRSFSEDYYRLLNYYSLANNLCNNFTFRKILHYEGISKAKVHELVATAIQNNKNLCELDFQEIKDALCKCKKIKNILDRKRNAIEIAGIISIANENKLQDEMKWKAISRQGVERLEHQEEEDAELEEIEVKKMGAVELMTIVGSKGLSADHVIIIGFDDINMKRITKNAFYVAMTRARKSLHILTALQSGGATKAHDFLSQLPDDHLEFYKYTKKGNSKSLLNDRRSFINYLVSLNGQQR
jgi:superfamily I DNA/RNA helicase